MLLLVVHPHGQPASQLAIPFNSSTIEQLYVRTSRMNLHPKTVHRVMVLIVGAGLIVATLVGVYVVRQRQIAAKYVVYRQAGMAAFAQEDYAAALKQLKQYIGKHRTDRDALYAYATSRSRVEEPDGRHLTEGIKAFQMLRDLEPDSKRVQRALLELYTRAYYNTEAIDLADKALAKEPDDVEALRAKAIALERLRRFDEAVAVSEHLNDVAPTNLEGQQLTYRLYQRTDKPAKEVIARAEAMRARYPDDPRFELLLAIAYGQSGDAEKARALLRDSAKRTPPDDPQFVRLLSMVLDRNRMFDESKDLLERAVAERNDPKLLAILVQRLWQNGYAKEAAERLKDLDPKSQASDGELLALRALALFELKRADEAMPIVEALASRTSDSEAQAWSTALATRYAKDAPEPREAIAQYRTALTRDPDNGVIRYMVGEAYERLGESEPALAAWRTAAELLPSWSKPAEKMARALAATGRTEEALMQAIAARRSAPHELSPAITYVVVSFKHLGQSNDPAKVDELLKLCESINAAQPNEPETLPIRIALLARKGKRDEAIHAARSVLSATTRPSSLTLLRLASISRTEKLGLEPEISSLIEQGHEPLTPALALARASELAAGGKVEQGL
jgi:tetratricopeptide (TPR) repeat protein